MVVGLLLLGGLLCLGVMWFEAHRNRIQHETLTFPDLPEDADGKRIFFISDIHRRKISETMIDSISGKVDWVFIGGDFIEKGVPLERVDDNLTKLQRIAPVYVIFGNNDYEVSQQDLHRLLTNKGVTALKNEAVTLTNGDDPFVLVGIDDRTSHRDDIEGALNRADKGFRLVLTHHPGVAEALPPDEGIRLVLAGHTHGGQIRFLKFGLYEKGHLWKNGNMFILISNGYGTTALPFRLGAPAETHLIKLKKENVL